MNSSVVRNEKLTCRKIKKESIGKQTSKDTNFMTMISFCQFLILVERVTFQYQKKLRFITVDLQQFKVGAKKNLLMNIKTLDHLNK